MKWVSKVKIFHNITAGGYKTLKILIWFREIAKVLMSGTWGTKETGWYFRGQGRDSVSQHCSEYSCTSQNLLTDIHTWKLTPLYNSQNDILLDPTAGCNDHLLGEGETHHDPDKSFSLESHSKDHLQSWVQDNFKAYKNQGCDPRAK